MTQASRLSGLGRCAPFADARGASPSVGATPRSSRRRALGAAALLALLLGRELDHVVDAQHGDGRLGGKLDHLDLGEGGLEDARLQVVLHLARDAVHAVVLHLRLGGIRLRRVVRRAQLGDHVGRVLRGVDGELLRDHEHRGGELGDRELLARAERRRKVLEVDGQRRLDAAAARHDARRLERALDGAEGVVQRALDLVEHMHVGAA
mmetsp:Transcript_45445/g.119380  ORF Transcript_45445/g.119380 Transcript_45445/m.119380 type:complete len:207 (+) Transcript_45445:186-806(+)